MKLFSAALALSSIMFAAVSGQEDGNEACDEGRDPDLVTKLSFYNSNVTKNELHLQGGELRYANVGTFENTNLDIVVTVIDDELDTDADYTDIAGVWASRNKGTADDLNGRWEDSAFARINLQTVKGKPKSGEGNFRFCIVEHNTDNEVALDEFTWTVYDTDERGKDFLNTPGHKQNKGVSIKEKMLFDLTQAKQYDLGDPTEIVLDCEDGIPPIPPATDCGTRRTVFKSTKPGRESDNPKDPDNLTPIQKKRSIAFTFENRACWEFTYDHYCPVEQPGYEGPFKGGFCNGKYTGGNFLFAGDSAELRKEGKCYTPSPVPATPEPTREPTPAPVPDTKTEPPVTRQPVQTTESPVTAPTLPPAPCPEDVTIVKTTGVTPLDLDNFIRILEQSTDTVTVRLFNSWKIDLGSIFYNYQKGDYDEKCYEVKNVGIMQDFVDVTIHCYHLKSFATLDICVQDDTLLDGDNASIPQCCNAVDDTTPVACYKVAIACDSVCAEDVQRQRVLRGVSRGVSPLN